MGLINVAELVDIVHCHFQRFECAAVISNDQA